MTKKDYTLIVEALQEAQQEAIDNAPAEEMEWYKDMYGMVVESLVERLGEDNARFNKEMFRKAAMWD